MPLAALTLAVLAVDASPPPASPNDCRADSDCVISTFAGCCGSCCPVEPQAVPRQEDEASRRRCAIVDCALPRCADVKCARPTPRGEVRAACRERHCVTVPVAAPVAECSSDADCTVEDRPPPGGCGACGCCPGMNPAAVSLKRVRREPTPPRPLVKDKGHRPPPFGLSSGGPAAPAAPQCSPCPSPAPAVAVCSAGRCVLSRSEFPD